MLTADAIAGRCATSRGRAHVQGPVPLPRMQKIAGGAENYFMAVPVEGYRYTQASRRATAPDLPNPVTREFCANCGTHLATRSRRGGRTRSS